MDESNAKKHTANYFGWLIEVYTYNWNHWYVNKIVYEPTGFIVSDSMLEKYRAKRWDEEKGRYVSAPIGHHKDSATDKVEILIDQEYMVDRHDWLREMYGITSLVDASEEQITSWEKWIHERKWRAVEFWKLIGGQFLPKPVDKKRR